MGIFGKLIALVLIAMAVACIGVVVERMLALRRNARDSRAFAKQVADPLDDWKHEEVIEIAERFRHSMLARLVAAMFRRHLRGYEEIDGGLTPSEMARREADRQKEIIAADLRRGMNVLASVGSVAPFVGLLGTVVGIIGAFQGIAATGTGGIGAVSAGIAEALVETALGLTVAIPAVLLFNYLTVRVSTVELALARSASELCDEMESRDGRKAPSNDSRKAA
jgi:biopolymer transport protein ExbB